MNRQLLTDFFNRTEEKANTLKRYQKLKKSAMLINADAMDFDFVGPFDNERDARRYRHEESGWNAPSAKIVSYERFKMIAPRMCV